MKICMMISTVRICMMNIADGLENRDIAIRIRIQQDGDTVMQIRIQQDPVIRREENVKNAGTTGDRKRLVQFLICCGFCRFLLPLQLLVP